ncbi:MAG: hypothetical protein ABH879_00795 [archaeon]
MGRGYDVKDGTFVLNREMTDLDNFVKDFVSVIGSDCERLCFDCYGQDPRNRGY